MFRNSLTQLFLILLLQLFAFGETSFSSSNLNEIQSKIENLSLVNGNNDSVIQKLKDVDNILDDITENKKIHSKLEFGTLQSHLKILSNHIDELDNIVSKTESLDIMSKYSDILYKLSVSKISNDYPNVFSSSKDLKIKCEYLYNLIIDSTEPNSGRQENGIFEIGFLARKRLLEINFALGPWGESGEFNRKFNILKNFANSSKIDEIRNTILLLECEPLLYQGLNEECIKKVDEYFTPIFRNISKDTPETFDTKIAAEAQIFKVVAMRKIGLGILAIQEAEKLIGLEDKHIRKNARKNIVVERWNALINCHRTVYPPVIVNGVNKVLLLISEVYDKYPEHFYFNKELVDDTKKLINEFAKLNNYNLKKKKD